MEMEKIKKQATFVRRYRFFFFFEIQERNSRLLGKIRVVQILTAEIRNSRGGMSTPAINCMRAYMYIYQPVSESHLSNQHY